MTRNRACCNPAHLFTGSSADNHADMVAKGRHARGETHGCRKLTLEQVRAIRRLLAEGMSLLAIAELYGVAFSTISHIRTGRLWRDTL